MNYLRHCERPCCRRAFVSTDDIRTYGGIAMSEVRICERCERNWVEVSKAQSFGDWFIGMPLLPPHACRTCGCVDTFKDGMALWRCRSCNAKDKPSKSPPAPITPRTVHDEKRFDEIVAAMARYREAKERVPSSWIAELTTLVHTFADDCFTENEKLRPVLFEYQTAVPTK